jgi:hypothetical protein
MHIWDLWYPNAAAQGLSFARCLIEPVEAVWVHAAPDALRVELRDDCGNLLASADQLRRTSAAAVPMAKLRREGRSIVREDAWPSKADIGSIVILPGGEAGVLRAWWNAADGSEWRWTVEFHNQR